MKKSPDLKDDKNEKKANQKLFKMLKLYSAFACSYHKLTKALHS